MKKLIASLFFIALAIKVTANAQFLEKFTAKDGLETAKNAMSSSNYQNLKLLAVLTANAELEYSGIPIIVTFDLNTGKSETWIYIFTDASDTTKRAGVSLFKSGDMFIPQTFDGSDIEIDEILKEFKYLDDVEWNDSGFFAEKIRANQDYQNFYEANKPLDKFQIALAVNSIFPELNWGEAYWLLQASGNSVEHECSVHSLHGTTDCKNVISDVFDEIVKNYSKVYPNPAKDYINIFLPEISNQIETQFSIFDIYGREIDRFSANIESNEIHYLLNQKGFSNGMYFIKYLINNKLYTIPFVIER